MTQATLVYGLLCALATGIFAAAAILYIRRASLLCQIINQRYPDLWQKIWQKSLATAMNPNQMSVYYRNYGRRIEHVVLFNLGGADYPDNPEFRAALSMARQAAFLCLFAFVLALILLGLATQR